MSKCDDITADLLHKTYAYCHAGEDLFWRPRRHGIFATQVQAEGRRADAVFLRHAELYAPLSVHGFEIKASRASWLDELNHPEKAEPWRDRCSQWWAVAPTGMIRPGEIPEGWGLLEPRIGGWLTATVWAPERPTVADVETVAAISMQYQQMKFFSSPRPSIWVNPDELLNPEVSLQAAAARQAGWFAHAIARSESRYLRDDHRVRRMKCCAEAGASFDVLVESLLNADHPKLEHNDFHYLTEVVMVRSRPDGEYFTYNEAWSLVHERLDAMRKVEDRLLAAAGS